MKRIIVIGFLFLAGCSNGIARVQNILEADGCQKTEVGGWSLYGEINCDKGDTFNNSFACVKNGHKVSGHVCSGLFKGLTIRYE